ncbi:MAG: peptidylprolyl isomerase, partial [Planctomycetaceae bacterium]|nr:peptidylprolyl isomerase [Planctomycetaceae bacterium]
MLRPFFARSMFTVCCVLLGSQMSWALQDEAPAKPEAKADAPVDVKAEWDKLSARKMEIAVKLAELRETFESAPVEQKRTIRDEYQALVEEFLLQISPEMSELAAEILEQDAENQEAAEFVMQQAWRDGDYAQAVSLADRLLEAGYETETVLNIGGAAHFAEQDFEKSVELLTKAEKNNGLDPQTGGRYLDYARKYVDLWKSEQEVRTKEAEAAEGEELPRVEMTTNKGKILIELFENEAPNTVANYISLVESGFFNGIKFHRVIPNFMIQGGDPNTKNDNPEDDGLGGPGYTIKCECFAENARVHFAGSLSMAHAGRDTGGSQFFVTHLPTPHLNPNNGTQSNHTVFGRVVEGLEIVRGIEKDDVIETATVVRKRDHEYKPETTADPEAEKAAEEKPATEKPATEKPATEKPATEKPATEKPATEKPATEKPAN